MKKSYIPIWNIPKWNNLKEAILILMIFADYLGLEKSPLLPKLPVLKLAGERV